MVLGGAADAGWCVVLVMLVDVNTLSRQLFAEPWIQLLTDSMTSMLLQFSAVRISVSASMLSFPAWKDRNISAPVLCLLFCIRVFSSPTPTAPSRERLDELLLLSVTADFRRKMLSKLSLSCSYDGSPPNSLVSVSECTIQSTVLELPPSKTI
jgi:hypothetical protein